MRQRSAHALTLFAACSALMLPASRDAAAGRSNASASSPPSPRTAVEEATFVAFDSETTGLNPRQDRVVELGAVKFRNGRIVEEKSWLINPHRSIPPWVQRVHGISPDMVKDEPSFDRIYPAFEHSRIPTTSS